MPPNGLRVVGLGPFGPPNLYQWIFDGPINQDGASIPTGLQLFFAVEGWVNPTSGASASGTTGVISEWVGTGSPTAWRITAQPASFLIPPGSVLVPQDGSFPVP